MMSKLQRVGVIALVIALVAALPCSAQPTGGEPPYDAETMDQLEKVMERIDTARDMYTKGEYEEATANYVKLWHELIEAEKTIPLLVGYRQSPVPFEIRDLVRRHEPARKPFQKLRDQEQSVLEAGDVTIDRLRDWLVLNYAVDDDDATVAWVERRMERDEDSDTYWQLEAIYIEVIRERKRYDLLSWAIKDPYQRAIDFQLPYADPSRTELMETGGFTDERIHADSEKFRERMALYCVLAALQDDVISATKIANRMLAIDGSDQAREVLLATFDEAAVEPIELPE